MNKTIWLNALICLAATQAIAGHAYAGQAASAPTNPVFYKNLNAPEIQSDNRKLQAILDKEDVPVNAAAASAVAEAKPAAPQTILVMQSAVTSPPPAPVAQPVTPPPEAAPARLEAKPAAPAPVVTEEEPVNDTAQEAPPLSVGFQEAGGESGGWYQWTHEPTAVFTACIAFFTFILAMAGGYHVYVAGATARRQLRAYVFITQTEVNGVASTTQPVSQLVIRNTGQTPAHDVMVYGNMIFDEFPLKKDLPVLVFSDPQLTKENLGPGSERYKWEYALTPLNEEQITKMHAGTHALYVYGEIRYRDVFRKKRFTKYLYYTGGNMGIRGTILGGYPEGNEAI